MQIISTSLRISRLEELFDVLNANAIIKTCRQSLSYIYNVNIWHYYNCLSNCIVKIMYNYFILLCLF